MSNETMESETRSYSMCDDDVKDMLDDGIGASNSDEIAERVGKETYLRRDEGKDREVECTLTEIGKRQQCNARILRIATLPLKFMKRKRVFQQGYKWKRKKQKRTIEQPTLMTWGAMSFSDSETDISSHDDIGVKEKKRKKPQEGHGTKSRRSYSS